jgi:chemotaxis protein CheC
VSFSVPHLNIESVGAILETLMVREQGIRYALVVHAAFRLRDTQVTGYMMIVLSVASLDRLIRAVEDWERSQHGS